MPRHVCRPSQDSLVWLGLMSREQLISPECSKHQILSFAKMQMQNASIYIYIYINVLMHNKLMW